MFTNKRRTSSPRSGHHDARLSFPLSIALAFLLNAAGNGAEHAEAPSAHCVTARQELHQAFITSNTGKRLAAYEELVRKYKDDPDDCARQTVGQAVIMAFVDTSRDEPLSGSRVVPLCDTLIGILKDSRSRSWIAHLLLQKAEQVSSAEAMALYDEVIATYGGEEDYDTRFSVSSAFIAKAEAQENEDDQLAILDALLERHAQRGDHEMDYLTMRALLARAALQKTDEEAIRSYDEALDFALNSPNQNLEWMCRDALDEKARLLGDRSIKAAFYDRLIERAPDSEKKAMLMADKISMSFGIPAKKKATDEFVAAYRDTDNPHILTRLVLAIGNQCILSSEGERDGYLSLLDDIIRETEAGGEAMALPLAHALQEKASNIQDREEKIALYNRIITLGKEYAHAIPPYVLQSVVGERARLLAR